MKKNSLTQVFLVLFVGAIVYFAGFLHGHKNLQYENSFTPKLVNKELSKPEEVDFSLFWEAYKIVQEKYLGSADPRNVVEGAVGGLISSLDDPYSTYLSEKESEDFFADLSGTFEGIGAELTIKDQVITVVAPLEDSPAQKAGVKAKDKILAVGDETTANMSLEQAVNKIRGPRGSEVTLTVLSENSNEPREVKIKRESIKIASVEKSKEGDIAVIKIRQFGDDTNRLIQRYTREVKDENAKGLILDLRNNPGGLLLGAIDVSSLFLPENTVVLIEKDKNGEKDKDLTYDQPILPDIPLVVLVNEGSASASEIVAGALRDHKRAKIIGSKTFGKGSVQDLIPLNKGTIRLTIAEWLTPEGKSISKAGIIPDIEVQNNEETPEDEVLQKALEELR